MHSLLSLLILAAGVDCAVFPRGGSLHESTVNVLRERADRVQGRGILSPIATGSAAGIAGGEVANGSPPLSSFFADLNPPVVILHPVSSRAHTDLLSSSQPIHGGHHMLPIQALVQPLVPFRTSPILTATAFSLGSATSEHGTELLFISGRTMIGGRPSLNIRALLRITRRLPSTPRPLLFSILKATRP